MSGGAILSETSTSSPASRPSRLPITIALCVTVFLLGLSAASIQPYRGIVAVDNLGMSNSTFALIASLSSVATAAVSLLIGHFSDRAPDRRIGVIVCGTIAAIGYGLIFLVPTQLSYIISFCVILPLGGALFSQTFSFARVYFDRTRPQRSEFLMSAIRTLFSLAWVLAPGIVGFVAAYYSVFGVFAAAATAQLACALIFASLFLFKETKIGNAPRHTAELAPIRSSMPPGRIVGIVGVVFLRTAIFIHLLTIPLLLTNNFHGTVTDVSINAAVCAGLEVPFMLAWGWAATRFSKEPVIAVSALIYALYLVLLYFAHSVHDVLWLQGLNAVGTAALVSLPISYMQDSIRGRVGLSTALLDSVTVIAQLMASTIFAIFSTGNNYMPVVMAGAAVTVLGAAALTFSKLQQRQVPAAT